MAGWIYNGAVAKTPYGEAAKRLGVLMVSGLIVGESLFNVALAGMIVGTSNSAPLALVPADFALANPLAVAAFAATVVGLYLWTWRKARAA